MVATRYNPRKFKELVLYIAQQSVGDEKFGQIKLNKLLYYSDFEAYAELGEAITHARYQRNRFGPTARALVPVQRELEEQGDAELETADYHGREQERLVARRDPRMDEFSPAEMRIIDHVMEKNRPLDGTEISNASHEIPGWKLAQDLEDIPYFTVLIRDDEPPDEIKREAAELGRQNRWFG